MIDTTLNSLCILICGLTVILSTLFIFRTDNLVTRILVGAAGIGVLVCRWSITMLIWQFIEAILTLVGLFIGLVVTIVWIGWMLSRLFRW